jgi:acetolactate synthase-1/2/3 large subunit
MIKFLEKWGVRHAFGFNGHGNWALLDSIVYESDIEPIRTRREDQAVHMADGYWRMNRNQPAIAVTTVGPGNSNVIPALANAFYDSSSLVLLTGATPTQWWDKGPLEEAYRYFPEHWLDIVKPISKRTWLIHRPEIALEMLSRACKTAVEGRPGPVVLHTPFDIQHENVEVGPVFDPSRWTQIHQPAPDPEAIRKAVNLIMEAEKPLVLAGGGIHNACAWDALREFVETFSIPCITTFMGKGALPEDHPLNLGVAGLCGTGYAYKAAGAADLIIALGARFNDCHTAQWRMYNIPGAKLIHIDIDGSEIGRNYPVDVGMVANARLALKALTEALKEKLQKEGALRDTWLGQIKEWKKEWEDGVKDLRESKMSPLHYGRVFHDASEVVKEVDPNTSVLFDTGNAQSYAPAFWKVYSRHVSTDGHWAQMGFATAAIIGAKLANPEHPAVAVTGDGSFFMTTTALATAYEYDIPCVWLVLNNQAILMETELMLDLYGREAYTVYRKEKTKEPWNPDVVKLAESLGIRALEMEKPEDVKPVMREALKSDEPVVINCWISQECKGYYNVDFYFPLTYKERGLKKIFI